MVVLVTGLGDLLDPFNALNIPSGIEARLKLDRNCPGRDAAVLVLLACGITVTFLQKSFELTRDDGTVNTNTPCGAGGWGCLVLLIAVHSFLLIL